MNRDEHSLSRRLENGLGLPDRHRRLQARDRLRAGIVTVELDQAVQRRANPRTSAPEEVPPEPGEGSQ